MRVRFAPSPTGFLHIGNARTAIVNHLLAKKHNAELILRIEDTDKDRSTFESEISIIEDLKWIGIDWTEGPGKDKGHGPYRQSERFDLYKKYTKELLDSGKAFKCFCTREQADEDKKIAIEQNIPFKDRCRDLPIDEQKKQENLGKEYTIKFKIPDEENIILNDLIKGQITFNSDNIGGDFIIVRSDGSPVYNYIVIIDDTLMEISHVVRGEDHLSNTPKQILIAKALNLPVPEYAHMPLIMGSDRKKLSKRHGITSVELYKKEGYLPEALINYLGLLGWATESGKEILPEDELIQLFDLSNLSKSAAIFDFQKLRWMNGQYIRNYNLSQITEMFLPYIKESGFDTESVSREKLENIINLIRGNCEILSDIGNLIGIFLNDINEPDEETDNQLKEDYAIEVISAAHEMIEKLTEDNITEVLVPGIKELTNQKGKKLFHPIRAIITGRLSGPDLDSAIPLIGYENIKKRIKYCKHKYC